MSTLSKYRSGQLQYKNPRSDIWVIRMFLILSICFVLVSESRWCKIMNHAWFKSWFKRTGKWPRICSHVWPLERLKWNVCSSRIQLLKPVCFCEAWLLLVQQKHEGDKKQKGRNGKKSWRDPSERNPIELNVIWPECAQPSAALQLY